MGIRNQRERRHRMIQTLDSTESDFVVDARNPSSALNRIWTVQPLPTTPLEPHQETAQQLDESETNTKIAFAASTWFKYSGALRDVFERNEVFNRFLFREYLEIIGNQSVQWITEQTDASTSSIENALSYLNDRALKTRVIDLFSLATFIDLEPGMTNEFSEGLEQVVELHGKQGTCGDKARHSTRRNSFIYCVGSTQTYW